MASRELTRRHRSSPLLPDHCDEEDDATREEQQNQKKIKKACPQGDEADSHNSSPSSFTRHRSSSSVPNKVDSNWHCLQAMLKKTKTPSKASHMHTNRPNQLADSPAVASTVSLVPKSDDCSLTKILALDCEMVGVGIQGKRNALARVSLVNSWGNVVYDKHVRPIERVTNLRTKFSGIRVRDLKKAEDFFVVQREVAELLQGRILVGHAIHYDLKVMYLSHPKKYIRDTSRYAPLCRRTGRPRALRDLCAEFLGIKIQQGEHDSVEDACAAMYVYQHFRKEWEQKRALSKKG